MGQALRRSRLLSGGAMTRIITLASSFALFYLLFLFARTDGDGECFRESAVILHNGSRHNGGALHSLRKDDDPFEDIGTREGGRENSFSGTVDEPLKTIKQLPSCVTSGESAGSFLMIFMGHSGSTAIISELQNHSEVLVDAAEPIDHNEFAGNTSLALEHTREFFSRGRREGKIAGFKMRPWHIRQDPEAWIALTREFKTRIIWQYRQNILKQAVGEYSNRYLNDDSAVEGLKSREEIKKRCSTGAGCRFKITDFPFFHRSLKDSLHSDMAIVRGVDLILNGSKCVHDMPYEDYLYDREDAMRRLQQFLGVEYKETVPSRFKATRDSLCDVVENWDEVCEKFYGCHVWRHMFDDEHNECVCQFSSGSTEYCDTVFDNEARDVPRGETRE